MCIRFMRSDKISGTCLSQWMWWSVNADWSEYLQQKPTIKHPHTSVTLQFCDYYTNKSNVKRTSAYFKLSKTYLVLLFSDSSGRSKISHFDVVTAKNREKREFIYLLHIYSVYMRRKLKCSQCDKCHLD